jgi:hypothetical protein
LYTLRKKPAFSESKRFLSPIHERNLFLVSLKKWFVIKPFVSTSGKGFVLHLTSLSNGFTYLYIRDATVTITGPSVTVVNR